MNVNAHKLLIWMMVTVVLLAVPLSSAYATCSPPQSGLVSWWKLDETSGTTVNDSIGSVNGTWNGSASVQSTAGIVGNAFSFTDTNSENVDLGQPAALDMSGTNAFTLSAWVYPNASPPGPIAIFSRGAVQGSVNQEVYELQMYPYSGDVWHMAISDGTSLVEVGGSGTTPNATVTYDTWQHVVATWDGTNLSLYKDGALLGTVSSPGFTLWDGDSPAKRWTGIGYDAANNRYYWDGKIDDVRIYNRALSADEIKALYQTRSTADAGAGTMVYDTQSASMIYCNGTNWVHAGTGAYNPPAVHFDGSTAYLTRGSDLTGNADTKKVTGSIWFRRMNSAWDTFWTDGNNEISIANDGTVYYDFFTTGSATELAAGGTNTTITDTNWHHFMFSFDVTGSDWTKATVYLDGVEDYQQWAQTDGTIDVTNAEHYIGVDAGTTYYYTGDMADVWIDFGTYLDLHDPKNRRKFISADGKPMYLGPDGSLPTGNKPSIFLSGDAVTFSSNRGTGGGFTSHGTINFASAQPADCAPQAGPFALAATYNTTTAPRQVWGDGKYIYVADNGGGSPWGVKVFSFDGSTFTLLSDFNTSTGYISVWGDGTYIYALDEFDNLYALTFDGTTLSQVGNTYPSLPQSSRVWGDGTYIYVTEYSDGISAFTFDGTNFTLKGADNPGGESFRAIWGDGKYIYVADDNGNGLYAYSFNGTAFNLLDHLKTGQIMWVYSVTGDGQYIYVGTNPYIYALTFDGSTLKVQGSPRTDATSAYFEAWTDGNYVYAIDNQTGLKAFTFDGSTFSGPVSTGTPMTATYGGPIWGDGEYVYVADDTGGVRAFSGFAGCNCGVNGRGAISRKGTLEYNGDFHVMQYCNGGEWVPMGPVGGTPPTSGLIHHWALDETSGTTVTDTVGGNNGTWSGSASVATAPGMLNRDFLFDGVDNQVSIADDPSLELMTDMSISVWAKVNTDMTRQQKILYKDHSVSPWLGWEISFTSNEELMFDVVNTSATYFSVGQEPVRLGEWYHVVAVKKGGDLSLYVNGEPATYWNYSPFTGSMVDSDGPLWIGTDGNSDWLDGEIDDIRIYDRALDPTEIKSLYNFGLSGGLGDVSNACASPTGVEGQMIYNTDYNVMQYCNGEHWIGIGQ